MTPRPELVDLLFHLDDPRATYEPEIMPMIKGLPISAAQMQLLGSAPIDEVVEAHKEAQERLEWQAVALNNVSAAQMRLLETLRPWWTGDMKLEDALEAAPADVRDRALAQLAEADRWARAVDDPEWGMTGADLEEGWLRGEFRRTEFDEGGDCIGWQRIAIIDPDVAEQRAGLVAAYREARSRTDALFERLVSLAAGETLDEKIACVDAALTEEERKNILMPTILALMIDRVDELHGVAVDDAGMPVGDDRTGADPHIDRGFDEKGNAR